MKKAFLLVQFLLFSILVLSCEDDLGLPYYEPGSVILRYTGYVAKYNELHEQAEWVAYQLTDNEAVSKSVERTDDFRSDPSVATETASSRDYRGSGYDRGHLAPARDMRWSAEAMSDSFYYSNMSPQAPGFNRGKWKSLEFRVRKWATANEEVYVITGPVLTDGPFETIGENQVAVPKHFYKVILDFKEPEIKAIGFILPNEQISLPLSDFAVSIDQVEQTTGIDFFQLLPDGIEESIESTVTLPLWPDLD
ncbi:unnamed protein product [marine sediment metagenome]|uniref:Endonuclease n=1 Tax=marine sediment metagenome TaxID=412755 RepID=X0VF62_9ZZZZ